jgi:hypothetical protein
VQVNVTATTFKMRSLIDGEFRKDVERGDKKVCMV